MAHLHAALAQVVTQARGPPARVVIEAAKAVDGLVDAFVKRAVDPLRLQTLWERRALSALDAMLLEQLLLQALHLDVVAWGLALMRAGKAHMPLEADARFLSGVVHDVLVEHEQYSWCTKRTSVQCEYPVSSPLDGCQG